MLPIVFMLGVVVISHAAGAVGIAPVPDWETATRIGLASLFLLGASEHFTRMRRDLIRTVPHAIRHPAAFVTAIGVAEIAGAIGLLHPALAAWSAGALIVLLVASSPATLRAARANLPLRGAAATPILGSLPLLAVWIFLLSWSSILA